MTNQTNQNQNNNNSPFAFFGEVSELYKNGVPVPAENISATLGAIADNFSVVKAFSISRKGGCVKMYVGY